MAERYQVFIQPLQTLSQYGVNVDVSDDISETDLGGVTRKIEAVDFDFGSFLYDKLSVRLINKQGRYNNEGEFFRFKRDLAKVQVFYIDKNGLSALKFRGLLNEAGSSSGSNNENVRFLIVSEHSILKQTKIDAGLIQNGDLFSSAIKKILDQTSITSVLSFDSALIVPAIDLEIDDSSPLDNKPAQIVLNQLLLASNSVFFVDNANKMNVRGRIKTENKTTFFGTNDSFGRENIIKIDSIREGYQRVFNSIIVNDIENVDNSSVANFGFRQKSFSLDFITDAGTADQIGSAVLTEFKGPKKELKVTVSTKNARGLMFLDEIELDIDNDIYNNVGIKSTDRFKTMSIMENTGNLTTILELRGI